MNYEKKVSPVDKSTNKVQNDKVYIESEELTSELENHVLELFVDEEANYQANSITCAVMCA